MTNTKVLKAAYAMAIDITQPASNVVATEEPLPQLQTL